MNSLLTLPNELISIFYTAVITNILATFYIIMFLLSSETGKWIATGITDEVVFIILNITLTFFLVK